MLILQVAGAQQHQQLRRPRKAGLSIPCKAELHCHLHSDDSLEGSVGREPGSVIRNHAQSTVRQWVQCHWVQHPASPTLLRVLLLKLTVTKRQME